MDATSDGLWDWDVRTNRVYYSPAWLMIIGEDSIPPVYGSWEKKIHPDDRVRVNSSLREQLEGKTGTWQCEHRLSMNSGGWKWVLGRGQVVARNPEGSPLRMVGTMLDITERKQSEQTIQRALAEKEVLLREVHHRVKNNLSGILSLIELQISSLSDPVQIASFKDLETRIRSMALVHDSLTRTTDLARINVAVYTENLTRHLLPAYGTAGEVRCRIEMGDITLPIETATPCGLVMNEIITNSLKYAFPKKFSCEEIRGEPCTIKLTLHREGSDYLLIVADNGIGMPEGTDATMSHSLGRFLIRFIVEHQLGGSLEISTARGTAYTIRFPAPAVKEGNTDEKM
jgi:PAS domain S-box-containing protein